MQEERRRRTWEAPDAPVSGSLGVWSTAREAQKGKPGDGTMLEPQRRGGKRGRQAEEYCHRESPPDAAGGVVSSIVLGGGESPPQGEGLDGSTQPGKETHPGHVGPDQYEPTSLRAIANRVENWRRFRPARKRVQPRNRMRENCTSGSARGAPGNRRPYRGGAAPVCAREESPLSGRSQVSH